MKLPKALVINKAHLFNSLNLAVGKKAMKVFNLQNEVAAIIDPFYTFRTKLLADMELTGDPEQDDKEEFNKYVEALTKYAEGDVELENVNFLTEEEFPVVIKQLTDGTNNIGFFREDMLLLKEILVERSKD